MDGIEKAINGLEHCKHGECVGCPYDQIREESLHGIHCKWELVCNEQLTEDILSLLKEQREKMDHHNNITLEYEKEVFRLQTLLKEQENEYEKGFNDAMLGKQELMYEDIDGKWHKKDW